MAKPGASPWNTHRYVGHSPTCGTSAEAWNIAVRTMGVFTHRDNFQRLACAERSLVRTANQPFSVNYGIVREPPSRRTEFEVPLFRQTRKPLVLSSPPDYLSKRNYMTFRAVSNEEKLWM